MVSTATVCLASLSHSSLTNTRAWFIATVSRFCHLCLVFDPPRDHLYRSQGRDLILYFPQIGNSSIIVYLPFNFLFEKMSNIHKETDSGTHELLTAMAQLLQLSNYEQS